MKFGKENNVSTLLGEFDCIFDSFKKNRGGERWVSEVIDICMKNNISFNYHSYHEEAFDLYQYTSNALPANPNQLLMKVFASKLK